MIMYTFLTLFFICILNLNEAKRSNAIVTLHKENAYKLFTEGEMWGMEFGNITSGIVNVEVVIEESKLIKISELKNMIMNIDIIYDDADEIIRKERERINNTLKWDCTQIPLAFFLQYRTWTEYVQFIDCLTDTWHPTIATQGIFGQTAADGTNIPVITLSQPDGNNNGKPGFFIQASLHAREWLANSATMYILNALAEGYADGDSRITTILNAINIYIVPTVNIDGFIYTHTTNRNWRKNRNYGYGVDLNRNYGYEWGGSGSSNNPSSDTYRGPSPFSESETQASRDFMSNPAYNIQAMFDMHTYSNLILYPWGYTYNTLPPADLTKFETLGQQQSDAIYAVHGQRYLPIQSSGLYPASGIAPDWAWGDQGIYGFTYEGRGTNFNPSATNIVPAGQEQLAAVLVMAEDLF